MDAEAEVIPPARDTEDRADLAAGAGLVPEADPATADPGLGPIPDPSLILPEAKRPRKSPLLDPDQGPGPTQSLGPEAILLHQKENPGLDRKVNPSQQKMEVNLHRAQRIISM